MRALVVALLAASCSREGDGSKPTPSEAPAPAPPPEAPALLYLPDGDIAPPPAASGAGLVARPLGVARGRCPAEMVDVEGRFCIDRWESMLVDVTSGRTISPYYPPSRTLATRHFERWNERRHRVGNAQARSTSLPPLEAWQRSTEFEPKAVARAGVVPNGYVSGKAAATACAAAGKRLCREDEWRTACRGERGQKYPWGDDWVAGACNVFREAHPASVLHDNPSIEHSDPRLNLVDVRGKPLLRKTGATPRCASSWGNDAIYDMVGNLDEWVDDPEGTFVGGFYARSTRAGCEARVQSHDYGYYDYSLGVRCCR